MYIQKFLKPEHNYTPVVVQALFLYLVYKLYKYLFVKPNRR